MMAFRLRRGFARMPSFLTASWACLLGLSADLAIAECPPPNPAPPSIPLAELRAGQYNVGLDNVLAIAQRPLRQRWNNAGGGAAGAAAVDAYLKQRPVPVVLGPNVQLHLVDNHHRTSAIRTLREELGAPFPDYVYYYVIADLSAHEGPAFWAKLIEGGPVLDEECNPVGDLRHQYLWPYDRGVLQDPNVNPPPMIPGLRDDVLRSISANARFVNGFRDFEDDETPTPDFVFFFQEFYWANFLRDRVFLQGANWEARGGNPGAQQIFTPAPGETVEQATKRLVASAALTCRGSDAMTLPGWACAADVLADGNVNGEDLGLVLAAWGTVESERYNLPTTDINRDGQVDGIDLGLILSNWGPCAAP
ncbi:MAG: hypothetical protein FGM39_02660 [Phycisphaerales bacterium]|nr:hypothetical protein [Phycisphaerales bacterium]